MEMRVASLFPVGNPKHHLDETIIWDKDYLIRYLAKNTDIYLLGSSGNIFDTLDLFDKVFYLDVKDDIQVKRLKHASRENPMGSTEYQRQNAVIWGHELRSKARNLGIEFIDADQTPEETYEQIQAKV